MTATLDESRAEFHTRCDTIEECYEFMLGYAAQGLPTEQGSPSGSQIREYLRRCDAALTNLAEFVTSFIAQLNVESTAPYAGFIDVLGRDARDARAAVQMVLAQPSVGSQLIDNLNASIHLRALLTDMFLIDEVLKGLQRGG